MSVGIVDSTVVIHLLRNNPLAMSWLNTVSQRLDVTSITWLEVMYGAAGKVGQARAKLVLAHFDLAFLTQSDQSWAITQLETHRLIENRIRSDIKARGHRFPTSRNGIECAINSPEKPM